VNTGARVADLEVRDHGKWIYQPFPLACLFLVAALSPAQREGYMASIDALQSEHE
jgi:hypothetical protein